MLLALCLLCIAAMMTPAIKSIFHVVRWRNAAIVTCAFTGATGTAAFVAYYASLLTA